MGKKRTGMLLLCAAAVAAVVGLVTILSPAEAPRPQTLEFSVQCWGDSRLTEVRVETPNDEGRAKQTAPDPHNPHFGAYEYAVTDVGTQYSLKVTCVRKNAGSTQDYTITSPMAAWGNAQNFECSRARNVCLTISDKKVAITVSCQGNAVATEMFVIPKVNTAGSATLAEGNFLLQQYTYQLATPVTPYSIEVTCTPKQGKAWTAKSSPNQPAIGNAGFNCPRPQLPHEQHGICLHT